MNEDEPRSVAVDGPLALGQFLKHAGSVSTGGEAKILISEGAVRVNGEVELRRGAKVGDGDVVDVREEKLLVQELGHAGSGSGSA